MAAPVVLAAAQPLWEELVAKSGLPPTLFAKEMPLELADDPLEGVYYFGEAIADADTLPVEEIERLDQILFACRSGTFVWLHRFGDTLETEIETLVRASAAWEALVGKRKRRYESQIRPVVVLLGGDSTTDREEGFRGFLEQFEARKSEIVFRDIFVMTPRLEPAGREIFHARNVWPLAVSRLLLYLSARIGRNEASAVYAWRFREIRHTDPGLLYERLLPACTDALFGKIASSESPVSIPEALPAKGSPSLEPIGIGEAGRWHAFDAVGKSASATNGEEILRRLVAAGQSDSGERVRTTLESWRQREQSLDAFWKGLHQRAGDAWTAQTTLRATARPEAEAAAGARADRSLQGLPASMAALDAAGESLKSAAAELATAQAWFVQRWYRLAVALSAASLVGVLFFRAAQIKFGSPGMAGLVAAGCFLGAIVASAVCYALESSRGEAGVDEWRARHKQFEDKLGSLNRHLVDLRSAGADSSVEAANLTLRAKLLRLVRRLTEAVAAVFERSPAAVPAMTFGDGERKGGSPVRFLARSTLRIGDPSALREEAIQDIVDHAVSKILGDDFLDEVNRRWQKVCNRSDTPAAGTVDAAGLQAELAELMADLPGRIDQIVSSRADSSPWESLRQSLEALRRQEANLDLLSVERSDTADLELSPLLLVSAALAEDVGQMQMTLAQRIPAAAEGCAPALLIETTQIRLKADLVSIARDAREGDA
jgi:hypothetical protein